MKTVTEVVTLVGKIVREVYGFNHGTANAPTYILEWSIDQVHGVDIDIMKLAIREINAMLNRKGSLSINFPYGHKYF